MHRTWEAGAAGAAEAAEAAKAEAPLRPAEAAAKAAKAAKAAEAAAIKRQAVLFHMEVVQLMMWAQWVPLALKKRCTRSPAAAILLLPERALPR